MPHQRFPKIQILDLASHEMRFILSDTDTSMANTRMSLEQREAALKEHEAAVAALEARAEELRPILRAIAKRQECLEALHL